jgi:hypothetical protein
MKKLNPYTLYLSGVLSESQYLDIVEKEEINEISSDVLFRASQAAKSRAEQHPSDQITKDRITKFKQGAMDRAGSILMKNEKTGEVFDTKVLEVYHANAIDDDTFILKTISNGLLAVDLRNHIISRLSASGKPEHVTSRDSDRFQVELSAARQLADKINAAAQESNKTYRKSNKTYTFKDLPIFRKDIL